MNRDLSALSENEFDLLIVGGGIFGACAAWDATQRGLSVAIVDRADFCSAASANSYKLVHGGIRYLQHADVLRVRESSLARRTFLRIAPHLVQPLPVVVPTYGHGMKSKMAMRAAMAAYDAITLDRNRGITDAQRQIPRGYCLSRTEVVRRYPGLDREGLTGAAVFCDGQLYNPPRLVLAYLHTATAAGAVAANYVEAIRFSCDDSRVSGITARDTLTGNTLTIRATMVLNAAGPYAEGLLKRGLQRPLVPPMNWSRDAFFVVARPLVDGKHAVALLSRSRDRDARFSRGARHLFLVPWRKYTLVGVWHKVYRGDPDGYNVSDEELEAWVKDINQAYAGLDLTRDDVSLWNAGLIPFGATAEDTQDLQFGHRSRLVDHTKVDRLDGLVTLIGVRFTTGPTEAARAIDLVFRKLRRKIVPSRSHMTPLLGGDIEDIDSLVRQLSMRGENQATTAAMAALARNHGLESRHVLDYARKRPELGHTIASFPVLKAEIVHAARAEMALTLADAVLRRTDLGTGEYPGIDALRTCAELLADELKWDRARVEAEVKQVVACYPDQIRARKPEISQEADV